MLITATGDVTVQGASINDLSTDAFLALPTHVLGTEYVIMSYLYKARDSSHHAQGPTQFGVIGMFDGTIIRVILPRSGMNIAANNEGLRQDESEFTVRVDQFEAFTVSIVRNFPLSFLPDLPIK